MRLFAALAMVLVATMASMQAQAQNRYGSIAFSQQSDGGYEWGITWNAESREAARSRAVAGCRSEGGRDCSEIFWFRNTCGALAIGSGNGWGAGSGATTVKAQRGALEKCRTTNRDCQIAVSRCAVASTTAVAQSLRYSSKREQRKLRDRYGSVAFSQQGDGGYQWGITWDFESREVARNRAIAGCRNKGGRSCSEIFQFRNTCGALAIGGANGWGAGAGATTLEAQRGALKQCRTTNRNCQVAVSRCAKASTTVATAGRSLSSAKAGSAAPQRNAASTRRAEADPSRTTADSAGARGLGLQPRGCGRGLRSEDPGGAAGLANGERAGGDRTVDERADPHPAVGETTHASGRRTDARRGSGGLQASRLCHGAQRVSVSRRAGRWRRAGQSGNSVRQRMQGVARNDAEAVRWYRKAARQGYANAQTNLGVMYDRGRGVRQNHRGGVASVSPRGRTGRALCAEQPRKHVCERARRRSQRQGGRTVVSQGSQAGSRRRSGQSQEDCERATGEPRGS